ncbi:hypothetical protein BDW42DRAFT_174595 [Aspergillus taichungensis]|uniref:Uncharacterized protein n=1 Tax=Aspergillus taichungensis TaxID=482145 RepID=A0A2J5HN48_9EURO|nr:hypothetical protein BDW42DRAFT_174595 [Aspergillus taichungensis]
MHLPTKSPKTTALAALLVLSTLTTAIPIPTSAPAATPALALTPASPPVAAQQNQSQNQHDKRLNPITPMAIINTVVPGSGIDKFVKKLGPLLDP